MIKNSYGNRTQHGDSEKQQQETNHVPVAIAPLLVSWAEKGEPGIKIFELRNLMEEHFSKEGMKTSGSIGTHKTSRKRKVLYLLLSPISCSLIPQPKETSLLETGKQTVLLPLTTATDWQRVPQFSLH